MTFVVVQKSERYSTVGTENFIYTRIILGIGYIMHSQVDINQPYIRLI
jgi:hypothetical protein